MKKFMYLLALVPAISVGQELACHHNHIKPYYENIYPLFIYITNDSVFDFNNPRIQIFETNDLNDFIEANRIAKQTISKNSSEERMDNFIASARAAQRPNLNRNFIEVDSDKSTFEYFFYVEGISTNAFAPGKYKVTYVLNREAMSISKGMESKNETPRNRNDQIISGQYGKKWTSLQEDYYQCEISSKREIENYISNLKEKATEIINAKNSDLEERIQNRKI